MNDFGMNQNVPQNLVPCNMPGKGWLIKCLGLHCNARLFEETGSIAAAFSLPLQIEVYKVGKSL
jgi:hypothetical protein